MGQMKLDISKIIKELSQEINKDTVSRENVINYLNCIKKFSQKKISLNEIENIMTIVKYIEEKEYFKDKSIDENNYIDYLIQYIFKNLKKQIEDNKIRNAIKNNEIIFTNQISNRLRASLSLNFDDLDVVNGERIIAIDPEYSPDLDGAFSIQKFDNIYILNVYISDVPSFLNKNKQLTNYAYERGTSYYIRMPDKDCNYNIDMLPPFLSHKYLSLNKGHPTNAIAVNFVIGEDGEIYSSSIDRKRIKVTDAITPKQAKEIIESEDNYGILQSDLFDYQELCKKVSNNTNDKYLANLNPNNIDDLIAFPSILVNYFIGKEAEFAIYRENGTYVKEFKNNPYTHSATPLRRFVSNINLAFFLNQKGIVSFSEKDLNYIETNIDEIIAHLIEKEKLSDFVNRNSGFVKKYIK